MPRGRQPLFPLYDRLLDGKLSDLLREWKAEGLSFEAMSHRLRSDHEVEVTSETVRRWWLDLEESVA